MPFGAAGIFLWRGLDIARETAECFSGLAETAGKE